MGIGKCETQRSVASHGNTGNRSCLTLPPNAIVGFNVGDEFLQEEIAVSDFPVGGVYVEAGLRLRCDDQEITDLVLLTQVFDQVPSRGFEQGLFILTEAVQEIEHRVTLCGRRIVSRRQEHTVVDYFSEDVTLEGVAIDTALCRCRDCEPQKERKKSQPTHETQFTRSAEPARDQVVPHGWRDTNRTAGLLRSRRQLHQAPTTRVQTKSVPVGNVGVSNKRWCPD